MGHGGNDVLQTQLRWGPNTVSHTQLRGSTTCHIHNFAERLHHCSRGGRPSSSVATRTSRSWHDRSASDECSSVLIAHRTSFGCLDRRRERATMQTAPAPDRQRALGASGDGALLRGKHGTTRTVATTVTVTVILLRPVRARAPSSRSDRFCAEPESCDRFRALLRSDANSVPGTVSVLIALDPAANA